MIAERLSEYRIMWILVLFDLPTETKRTKKLTLCFASSCFVTDSRCSNSPFILGTVQVRKTPTYIYAESNHSCLTWDKLEYSVLQTSSLAIWKSLSARKKKNQ